MPSERSTEGPPDDGAVGVAARYRSMLDEGAPAADWAYAWRSRVSNGGFKASDLVMGEVVTRGKCVGCAACVTICPVDVFDYVGERPIDVRADGCVHCILCAEVCPVLQPTGLDMAERIGMRDPVRIGGFGPYSYAVLTQSGRADVRAAGQDGGTVSSLLLHALESGAIQGAVLGDVEEDDPHAGVARLATTPAAILRCAGSRYTYSPNTLALSEAIQRDVRPLAVVGVPCQVDGVRRQQHSTIEISQSRWYRENVGYVIGLFCSEAFTHHGMSVLADALGVSRADIVRINVKGKVIVTMRDGRTASFPLKEFRPYARPACHYCLDYSADHADISVGGIGLEGWTYTVVRTEAGHELLRSALDSGWLVKRPISSSERAGRLLVRLAGKKAQRQLPALMPDPDQHDLAWVDGVTVP